MFEKLQPADFSKDLDPAVFAQWKELKRAQLSQAKTNMMMWIAALAVMIVLQGIIGLVIFFGLMLTSIFLILPKNKAVAECQSRLGITNQDVNAALVKLRKK